MRRARVSLLLVLVTGCVGAANQPVANPHQLASVSLATPEPAPAAPPPQPTTRAEKRELFTTAYRHIEQGEFEEATPLFEVLLRDYPQLEDYSLYYLALSYARTGDGKRAADLWSRLSRTHPQSLYAASAALEHGRILRRQGEFVHARTLLLLAQDRGDEDVVPAATVELAEIDIAAGDLTAAHRRLMSVRHAVPGTSIGIQAKQRVLELRQQDPTLVPDDTALKDEARLLLREGDFAAAKAATQHLLATAPQRQRPTLLRLRADAERGTGDSNQSLATLREIADEHPHSAAAPKALFRYASLLWNRDHDAEARKAFVEFRRRYPNDAQAVEALYAIARVQQAAGQTEHAIASYTRLARTYPQTRLACEARWRVGWIYYRDSRWRDAADTFGRLEKTGRGGRTADARYWQARALEHAGDHDGAQRIYHQLLNAAPTSYYAHWAEKRLGLTPVVDTGIVAPQFANGIGEPPAGVADRYHLIRARELQALGLPGPARAELQAFALANPRNPAMVQFLIDAYPAVDGYRDAIRLASTSRRKNDDVLYPLAFWPLITKHATDNSLDPLLVLTLMRQESLFDPAARSHADARGLMQLLPSTAERVAQRLGRPSPVGDLYDPETNVRLGIAHVEELLAAYNGDSLKALAAYNGGEQAVAKWETRFGHLEPDEFVESITYRETRDYVKKVLANYRHYQQRYGTVTSDED